MPKKSEDDSHDFQGKTDLTRMGIFTEAKYISTGEPFNDKRSSALEYRSQGKQFQVTPIKSGHDSKEAYFDQKFSKVFNNEPKPDQIALRRAAREKSKLKNVSAIAFRPSGGAPKPSGKGSWYGTIEQQFPTKKLGAVEIIQKEVTVKKTVHEPKNFLTSPGKIGGFGCPNTTIGKPYAYQSDPFNHQEELLRLERVENLKKCKNGKAFVTSGGHQQFFNPFSGLPRSNDDSIKVPKTILAPFKPTSKCGFTLNPYPTYEAPFGETKVAVQLPKTLVFKPAGMIGTYPVRSLIESNCPLAAPQWIQKAIDIQHGR